MPANNAIPDFVRHEIGRLVYSLNEDNWKRYADWRWRGGTFYADQPNPTIVEAGLIKTAELKRLREVARHLGSLWEFDRIVAFEADSYFASNPGLQCLLLECEQAESKWAASRDQWRAWRESLNATQEAAMLRSLGDEQGAIDLELKAARTDPGQARF